MTTRSGGELDWAKLKQIAADLTARGVPDAEIEVVLQRQADYQSGKLGAITKATNRFEQGQAEVADAEENVRRQSMGAGDIQNMGDVASLGLRQPITSALKAVIEARRVAPARSFGESWDAANAQEGDVRRAYEENTSMGRRLAVGVAPGLLSGKTELQLAGAGLRAVAPKVAARLGESWLGRMAASKVGQLAASGAAGAATNAALTTDTSQDEGVLAGLAHRGRSAAGAAIPGAVGGVLLGSAAGAVARRVAPAIAKRLPSLARGAEGSVGADIAKIASQKASDLSENEIDTLNRWVNQNGGLDAVMARLPDWEQAGRGDVVRLVDLINDPRVLRELRGAAIGSKDAGAILEQASDLPGAGARLNRDVEVVSGRSRAQVMEGGESFKERRLAGAQPSYAAADVEARAFDAAHPRPTPPRETGLLDARGNPIIREGTGVTAHPAHAAIDAILDVPDVRKAVRAVKGSKDLMNLPDDDHRVLSAAYKWMQEGPDAAFQDANTRRALGQVVTTRAPSWGAANAGFAEASAGRDLYERGQRFLSGKESAFSDAATIANQRGVDLTRFRDGVIADFFDKLARGTPSDPATTGGASRDLVKRVFGTADVMRKMQLALGDAAYGKMLERLRTEALIALRDRGLFAGSNTADKVADLMDDTNPEKALEAAWQLVQGHPVSAGVAALRSKGTDIKQFVNRATGRAGTFAERAKVATTQGAPALRALAARLRTANTPP